MNEAEKKRFERTQRMRPETTYNSWILLIVTVTVVIFIGLVTWYGRFPKRFALTRPTDHERIFQLAQDWQGRHPQIPGPPSVYLDDARGAMVSDHPGAAVNALIKALALTPDDGDALLMLTMASANAPEGMAGALSDEDADEVIEVIESLDDQHRLLDAAKAWRALDADAPAEALALLPAEPKTLEASLARFYAVLALDQDPLVAAEAVLAVAPAASVACEAAARRQILSGLSADSLRILNACIDAGADNDSLERLRGDALDRIGHFEHALSSYTAAGVHGHAAAIMYQEGLPGDPMAAFDAPTPDAALHKVWWGLLDDNQELVQSGVRGVIAAGIDGLAFDAARAAVALINGDAQGTLEILDGVTEPEAETLRAQAQLALGQIDDALASAARALEAAPNNHRLALLQARILRVKDAAQGDRQLNQLLETHPMKAALYQDARQRTLPWRAIIPTRALVEGLDEGQAAMVRALLGEGRMSDLQQADGAVADNWKTAQLASPLNAWPAPPESDALLQDLYQIQQLIEQGQTALALERLDVLSREHREAVGLQRLLYETRVATR